MGYNLPMNINELLEKLNQLNLPRNQYAIVGSGPLAVRGIREAHDLDILVTPELWDQLSQQYPVKHTPDLLFDQIELENLTILGRGSVFRDNPIASVDTQIKTADVFMGHNFLNLDLLKKFKAKLGREKDFKDIELINEYLASQKP